MTTTVFKTLIIVTCLAVGAVHTTVGIDPFNSWFGGFLIGISSCLTAVTLGDS